MTLRRNSTLQEVALAVGAQFTRRGIRAVLTGGACVAIYTGTYVSKDADFILQSNVRQPALDDALSQLGVSPVWPRLWCDESDGGVTSVGTHATQHGIQ